MLHGHIALALELISMTLSGLLILACCRYYDYGTGPYVNDTVEPERSKARNRYSCGFYKIVGYLIFLLSLAGFVCTAITICSHYRQIEKIETTMPLNDQHEELPVNNEQTPPIKIKDYQP